jgi:short-subunit dehydrogenase
VTHAAAWVNLLSIYALSNYPPHGTFSASKAAAYSLAQCLRAEMRPGRHPRDQPVPGPIDDEWNQNLPPPKVAPSAIAGAIVKALRDGVETCTPATWRRSGSSAGATTRSAGARARGWRQ